MTSTSTLPVAIVGAGPVGLAAAAHLVAHDIEPLIFERGAQAGATVAEWAHVRVFSPWKYNVDAAARTLLEGEGWRMPDQDYLPTGGEIIRDYLTPLAAHPAIAPHLRLNAEVIAISREGHSKLDSERRDEAPFTIVWRDADGVLRRAQARAVIDASGTWVKPNPIGRDGLPVEGEIENGDRIVYGIPDIAGDARGAYEGLHTLVIGSGHSAINAALDLIDLKDNAPETRITWATRSGGIGRLLGGGLNDALPGRGRLGLRAVEAIRSGAVTLRSPFSVRRIEAKEGSLMIDGLEDGGSVSFDVDRIIVATGFRPDLTPLAELRISLDPAVEAPPQLAPLIDPNQHSCGTVRPHGVVELAHPEKDFYIAGAKSYGRAPTFLMTTGYEQVRSIVCELAGEHDAAREVHLELPETGVCNSNPLPLADNETAGCCGGAPKQDETACCVADEEAKAEGLSGCGCGSANTVKEAADS